MTVEETIKKIISDKLYSVTILDKNITLIGDLGLDSLDRLELFMNIEKEYDIMIPDEEVDANPDTTVGQVIEITEKYIKLKQEKL